MCIKRRKSINIINSLISINIEMDISKLPKVIEDIILDYVAQIEHSYRLRRLNIEFNEKINYYYFNSNFSKMCVLNRRYTYYYYSVYFSVIVCVSNPDNNNGITDNTRIIRF